MEFTLKHVMIAFLLVGFGLFLGNTMNFLAIKYLNDDYESLLNRVDILEHQLRSKNNGN